MYSRKLGFSDENGAKSLESFNERLREQYKQKIKQTPISNNNSDKAVETVAEKNTLEGFIESAKSGLSNLNIDLDFDSILLLGVIILILTDANPPDLVLIGILASLIF